MDTRTPEQRHRIMQAVRSKDTGPEMIVRRLLYGLGYRYRVHCRELPGTPDLVFKRRGKVIFVHGCFWHGHQCSKGRAPKSRHEYWGAKLALNRERDRRCEQELLELGWQVLTIWQCQTKDISELKKILVKFLGK